MSTNKTEHLSLNDWVGTDLFKREELNANFRTLDAKAKEHSDKLDEHTTKLAETSADVSSLQTAKADKTEINTLASGKADKTYVDTLAATLASGSPKGTYATLSALQTAFPTGNTNIYVVTADGKWYFWNGSAWTAGGTYQATALADDSITPIKINDIKPLWKKAFILRSGGKLPILDNTAKTLTFPSDDFDMIVYVGDVAYTGVVPPYTTLTIDLNVKITSATSAWCMLFKLADKTFEFVPWNAAASYKSTHALFGTIRVQGGKYHFNFPFPYIIDGKLYGYVGESTNTPTVTKNPLDAFVKAVNHRGYSTEAPENTLPAYKLSKQKGYSYVECDVSWTSDNIPVLLHDDTIDRTANGTGSVNSKTLAELKTYDFGSWKSSTYAGTRIPTFEEFIILCKKLSLHPYIETKGTITSAQASTLVNIVKKLGMVKNVTWISFNINHLNEILNVLPSARVGWVIEAPFSQSNIDSAVALKTATNDVFIDCYHASVTTPLAESSLMSGIPIEVWTLNVDSVVSGLVDKGVSGITTDNLNIAEILST